MHIVIGIHFKVTLLEKFISFKELLHIFVTICNNKYCLYYPSCNNLTDFWIASVIISVSSIAMVSGYEYKITVSKIVIN